MHADEYVLDLPQVREFIARVRSALAEAPPTVALEQLRPVFAQLLADPVWLPSSFRQATPGSGMGGGIASWLLFRAGDGSLALFSLVVPPGTATPVHDHLAWGIVGLYTGEQDEEVYGPPSDGQGPLAVVARQHLRPGDFYILLPPDGDIHRVRTTSPEASVSIHLLGNGTGCIWRHTFVPEEGRAQPFRSGWSNAPCREAVAAKAADAIPTEP
jgi:predicted metal-dependent enzyme (double-stranded beta helix superfamily)